jgi:hypothetical protein
LGQIESLIILAVIAVSIFKVVFQVEFFLYGHLDTGVLQHGIRTRPFRKVRQKFGNCCVLP